MTSNYKIKVNIEIVECSEETQAEPHQKGPGVVEFVISEQQGCNIDECEKALLQANFPALREVLSDHLTVLSKKKACEKGSDCRINEVPYRVDGEVGRFGFNTHSTTTQSGTVWDTYKHLFSPLKGKEWYRTQGFKEVAIVHGTVERSYRETRSLINRIRYQPEATPLRTLSDSTESEGEQLQNHIYKFSADIIEKSDFDLNTGFPSKETEYLEEFVSIKTRCVKEAMEACTREAPELQPAIENNPI